MLIRLFDEVATSIPNSLVIITFLSLSANNVLSQSVLKDLMMMSPEWANFEESEHLLPHHRKRRETFNPSEWYLPSKGCNPTCRAETAPEICIDPPSRKELCSLLNNAPWCCQEWAYTEKRPQSVHFKANCDVACVPYSICPYPTCRLCAEINNEHDCCKTRNCVIDKVFTAPDGTALVVAYASRVLARSAAVTVAPSAAICMNIPDTLCSQLDGNPSKCRLTTGCAYNCASGACQNSGMIYGMDCYESCENHCLDKCGCTSVCNNIQTRKPGCIFNGAAGSCTSSLNQYCKLSDFPGTECSRKNGYYSVGGVICQARIQKGNCALDFVVASANLGSDQAKTDSDGIEYLPEAQTQKEDPLNISQPISFTPSDIKDNDPGNQEIYSTAVVGNVKPCKTEEHHCIDYIIPTISWDGDYELGLRMVEGVYADRNKRHFSVRFADVEVLSEFDIIGYSTEKNHPVDLFINFKVSQMGKTITVKGHKPSALNSTVKLSLCRAECSEDNSFIMSAFHIIKQQEEHKSPCDPANIRECNARNFDSDECKRAYGNTTFYAFGGKFCKSSVPGAVNDVNCETIHVIKAVNFNGLSMIDSRGIKYEQDILSDADDLYDVKQRRNSYGEATGYEFPKDRDLYNALAYADPTKLGQCADRCNRYTVTLGSDGNYELAVRTADDESDAAGERKFNVLLGDVPVFPEVDLFHLTGVKSQAVDLTLNFDVIGNGSSILLKGYDSPDDLIDLPADKSIQVSFCTSQCDKLETRSWLVGAFSIVSFGEPDLYVAEPVKNATCGSFDKDFCGCKRTTFCEYNVVTQACRLKKTTCPINSKGMCRKVQKPGSSEQVYVEGGVFCQMSNTSHAAADCDFDTVFGVNFGAGYAVELTDNDGIHYMKDEDVPFEDPFTIKGSDIAKSSFVTQGFTSGELSLYRQYMWGKVSTVASVANTTGQKACVTYKVPNQGNGRYELVIRTGEYDYENSKKNKHRDNSFVFNGITVAPTFEPRQYVFHTDALTIRIPYRVFGDVDQMQMDGYNAAPIDSDDGSMPFSFCPGECTGPGVDQDFKVGGFAAIKLRTNVCGDEDGDSCGCRGQGNCEYNVQGRLCQERTEVCNLVTNTGDECRRGGKHVFYAQAGQVCPTTGPSGNCTLDRVVLAVNLGDKVGPHKDINGIEYVTIKNAKFSDPDMTRREFPNGSAVLTTGIPSQDLVLYQKYEWGHPNNLPNPHCVGYTVPLAGDGEYELSIKTGEVWYTQANPPKRAYSFKLNGQYIVKNFEPQVYSKPHEGMDLNANFRVAGSGTRIELRGQSPSKILSQDGTILFEVCHGKCSWPGGDNNWLLGAFSIVKLQRSKFCNNFDGDSCACRFHGPCQFNVVSQECDSTVEVCAATCQMDNQCRRGGDNIFYVNAGSICGNSQTFGNCQVDKTLLAINFFGEEHTDVNGIKYQTEAGVPYDDPFEVVRNGTAYSNKQFPVEGVPAADVGLYNTSMFSVGYSDLQTCVTYHVPTDGDGDYELAVKFAELWYTQPGQREFSYYFNEQAVVKSLDMAAVRDAPNKGFDLITNYRIVSDRLQMNGYPQTKIKSSDGTVPLQFCPGLCECDWKDHNFQVAAVSVVKFKPVPFPVGLPTTTETPTTGAPPPAGAPAGVPSHTTPGSVSVLVGRAAFAKAAEMRFRKS